VPFSERDTVFFGAGVERTSILEGTFLPTAYKDYVDVFGISSTAVPLTVGWARDNRDSALVPTVGVLQRATSEMSVGGEVRYIRGTYQYQQFFPITKQYNFAFNGDLALGQGTEGKAYPIFKNFYGGGLGSVRGFSPGSLGPKDPTTQVSLGGNKRVSANFEFQAPFPGTGNDRTLRMYSFFDIGNVFASNEAVEFSEFRSSLGVGVSWISPLGPLRLEFATPVRSFEGDRIQNVQFQIGTSF
jgi:outer membrane protein insertion porin family